MVEGMLSWVVAFIAAPSVARAVAFGLVSGMMLTQWVKFQLPDWLSNRAHANGVRLIASLLAAATVAMLWPAGESAWAAVAVCIGTGLTTPFAYWLGIKVLYRFFPWTEAVISARPSAPDPSKVTVPPNQEEGPPP